MADIMKQFIRHMDGMAKFQIAHSAAKAMAQHCDARIERARKALDREGDRLERMARRKNGGPTPSEVAQAFQRVRTALSAAGKRGGA